MSTDITQIELESLQSTASGGPLLDSLLPVLGAVKVQLSVRVGGAQLSVSELFETRQGAVIALDRLVDQPLDVLVDGNVIARGMLVAVGDHFGVRITETANVAARRP